MDDNNNNELKVCAQAANKLIKELQNLCIRNRYLEEAVEADEMRLSARNDRLSSLQQTFATLEHRKKSLMEDKRKNIEACILSAREHSQNKLCTPATHLLAVTDAGLSSGQQPTLPLDQHLHPLHHDATSTILDSHSGDKMREICDQLCLLRRENEELAKQARDCSGRAEMMDRSLSIGNLSAQVKASRDKQMLSEMKKQVHALQNSIKILELALNQNDAKT
ncbi:unnamed protein product [Phytomonas sp. EM1]|nr:unnamed protein product [Phytomonas sp. EM1]|eukprot:CCW62670.1 unnamed protein product [Phytomonas sp. isolate EM1]